MQREQLETKQEQIEVQAKYILSLKEDLEVAIQNNMDCQCPPKRQIANSRYVVLEHDEYADSIINVRKWRKQKNV